MSNVQKINIFFEEGYHMKFFIGSKQWQAKHKKSND